MARSGGLLVLRASLRVAALSFAFAVHAQAADALATDLLHSDLPIFGQRGDEVWPIHWSDDESFGCTSRVAFGDWALRRTAEDAEVVEWYRFRNYGVFHCWANIYRASERAELERLEPRPSFFVPIGDTTVDGKKVELWVIQLGVLPGSDYLLLSREPGNDVVRSFNVLQTACPPANVRKAELYEILLTRYCVINSRSELIKLARRMAQLPPVGVLSLQVSETELQDEADD